MSESFTCQAFAEGNWIEFRQTLELKVRQAIKNLDKAFILGVDEGEYKESLVESYTLNPLAIDLEDPDIGHRNERQMVNHGHGSQSIKDVYVFTVSCRFTGSAVLFKVRSSSFYTDTSETIHVNPKSSKVSISFTMVEKDAEKFKRKKSEAFQNAYCNLSGTNREAESWNNSLPALVNSAFNERKKHFLDEAEFFKEIKIKTSPASDEIFSVQLLQKKKIPQPQAMTGKTVDFVPTFPQEIYKDVLDLFYNLGRIIEQKPSLYIGKREEGLRDLFLLFLETRYEGTSATGETFNRGGKTDILLKYQDGTNLFVAECKFWHGPKEFHKAISQLFDNYLTWRDSKTALMFFVTTKEFSKVLRAIQTEAPKHRCFRNTIGHSKDTSFTFEFCLPGDAGKTIQLQIMAFHFDKKRLGQNQRLK